MQEFPSKFSNPAFCHLISLIDLSFKLGTLLFFEKPLLISGWSLQEPFRGKFVCMGGRGNDPMTFKRNLHSLGCLLLIRWGSACLLLRQTRGPRCNVASWNSQFPNFWKRCILQSQMSNADMPKGERKNWFVNYAACNIILFRTTFCCKKRVLSTYLGFKRAFLKGWKVWSSGKR